MARSWNAPTREAEDTSAVRPSLSRSGWPWRRRRQATIYFSLDGGVQIRPDRVPLFEGDQLLQPLFHPPQSCPELEDLGLEIEDVRFDAGDFGFHAGDLGLQA